MVDEVLRAEPYLEAHELAKIFSVEEFEPLAKERMPIEGYGFYAGWAGTGAAARGNLEAYTRWRFRMRALIDVTKIDTSTTVLGRTISLPVMFAPTALHRFAHPDAELATARAAEALGTTMIVSSGASVRFEEVGPTLTKPWFQLYWFTDRGGDTGARRAGRGERLRGHRRDRRHAGPVVARGRGPVAAAAVAGDLVGQPAARRRSASRGRRQPDLGVAGVAPVDHVAADPGQGHPDRRGRAAGRGARARRDRRVEPRRPSARLVAGDPRRAARDRRGGRRPPGDPDGRRHPARDRRPQGTWRWGHGPC